MQKQKCKYNFLVSKVGQFFILGWSARGPDLTPLDQILLCETSLINMIKKKHNDGDNMSWFTMAVALAPFASITNQIRSR